MKHRQSKAPALARQVQGLFPVIKRGVVRLAAGRQLYAALDLNTAHRTRGSAPKIVILVAARSRREAINLFLTEGPLQCLVWDEASPTTAQMIKKEMVAQVEAEDQFAIVRVGTRFVSAR